MTWLKTTFGAIGAAVLAALAFFAVANARRHKETARKWQEKAQAERESDVEDSVKKANQALSQAKLHNAKAKEKQEAARAKIDGIAKKDPDMASIVSGWKSSRLRD